MSEQKLKIVIAGAGGMGALFGAILQEGGHDITLYDTNSQHVAVIQTDHLRISGYGGDRTVEIVATDSVASIRYADLILFQCKAYGTREAARTMRPLVDGGAICISFQNGLGNEEVIAEEVGVGNVLGGLTAMAGYMHGPGMIQDFARVPSYIGELNGGLSPRVERFAELLTAAGLETHASADIQLAIWKKLLGNIALSAVSGLTNLTSAEALAIPALKATCFRALDEALAVATSVGIDLDRESAVAGMEIISEPGGTGDNKSSLCVDLLNGRPTEVDNIYGTVITLARENDISTPTLDTLAALIKGRESHHV